MPTTAYSGFTIRETGLDKGTLYLGMNVPQRRQPTHHFIVHLHRAFWVFNFDRASNIRLTSLGGKSNRNHPSVVPRLENHWSTCMCHRQTGNATSADGHTRFKRGSSRRAGRCESLDRGRGDNGSTFETLVKTQEPKQHHGRKRRTVYP